MPIPTPLSQEEFTAMLTSEVREAVRFALVTVLEEEVTALVGALPFERSPLRSDRPNGHYRPDLDTSAGLIESVPVPRTRRGYKTQLFERYARRTQDVDTATGEMFMKGVSTRVVGEVWEALTGSSPSDSTVSRVFHTPESEYQAWKMRPLCERYEYIFADGTYFTVIYGEEGCKMPILVVIGISPSGEGEVPGFSVGDRENQAAWGEVLEDLRRRGVREIGLLITDGQQAMLNALSSKFPGVQRQRCIKHKMQNVLGYLPRKHREEIGEELKAIFYQENEAQARQVADAFCLKYAQDYPWAVECLRRDFDACLTFYTFPPQHWKAIRTTNAIERLTEEVKKRSHKMSALFRNEGSCLLMFYAVIRGVKFQRLTMPLKQEKQDSPAVPILFYTTLDTPPRRIWIWMRHVETPKENPMERKRSVVLGCSLAILNSAFAILLILHLLRDELHLTSEAVAALRIVLDILAALVFVWGIVTLLVYLRLRLK
jgi:transposase-like protein